MIGFRPKKGGIYPPGGAQDGYDHGVIDVARQLFRCGMVWDGNLTAKSGRDYLVHHGYAVKYEGVQALTGKGVIAMLCHWRTYSSWRVYRRRTTRHPLIAERDEIKRALS